MYSVFVVCCFEFRSLLMSLLTKLFFSEAEVQSCFSVSLSFSLCLWLFFCLSVCLSVWFCLSVSLSFLLLSLFSLLTFFLDTDALCISWCTYLDSYFLQFLFTYLCVQPVFVDVLFSSGSASFESLGCLLANSNGAGFAMKNVCGIVWRWKIRNWYFYAHVII